ncbi:MAG TPA: hypothetical protein ENG21_02620 [Nitrososphaeria archaeon]|nr:hypothetical protein [Nitrososphaeria archaeon]
MRTLGYIFSEIESVVKRANPLILGALIEGIHVLSSKRMMKLKEGDSLEFEESDAGVLSIFS